MKTKGKSSNGGCAPLNALSDGRHAVIDWRMGKHIGQINSTPEGALTFRVERPGRGTRYVEFAYRRDADGDGNDLGMTLVEFDTAFGKATDTYMDVDGVRRAPVDCVGDSLVRAYGPGRMTLVGIC